jgi:hypothetical protein
MPLGCGARNDHAFPVSPNHASSVTPPVEDPLPLGDFEPERFRQPGAVPAGAIAELVAPSTFACQFETEWSGSLRLASDTEPFGEISEPQPVVVTIPLGDAAQGAYVSIDLLGVQLDGVISARELELYTKRTTSFEGYLWTRRVQWTRGVAGALSIQPQFEEEVHPASAATALERSCDALTLDSVADSENEDASPIPSGKTVLQARLRQGERVPISTTPGGVAVALLDTAAQDDESEGVRVAILETRHRFRRVALSLKRSAVVGWIPRAALQPKVESAEWFEDIGLIWAGAAAERTRPYGADDPTRVATLDRSSGTKRWVCAWNAPLAAENAAILRRIGTLSAGIPLIPLSLRDGWREVQFVHPVFTASRSTRFWVPDQYVYPCISRQ